MKKDRLRDDLLDERGYRVVRVTNGDVMTNMDGVLRFDCDRACRDRRPFGDAPPQPLP